jgi:AraC-like DNA-binding protein
LLAIWLTKKLFGFPNSFILTPKNGGGKNRSSNRARGHSNSDHLSQNEPFLCIHFNISSRDSKKNKNQLFVPGLLPNRQIAQIPSKDFVRDVFALAEKYRDQNIPLYVFDHFFLALFQLFISAFPPECLTLTTTQENIQNYTYQRIFNYFNDCLSNNNFSIKEFCKILNCSPRTLSRICNEYFYQSPHKAFQAYRLHATLRYLQENPNATVKETAELFGYANAFHFSKAFKKIFAISPSRVKYELK